MANEGLHHPTIMTRIERIRHKEQLYDRCQAVLKDPAASKASLLAIAPAIAELQRYYASKQWRRDFEADAAGKLPQSLKRGVLSEDGLWLLLEAWREKGGE